MAAGQAQKVLPAPTSSAIAVPVPASTEDAGAYTRYVKRAFDIVFGTALLLALLPVMSIVALVVLVTSGRPILYASERIGRDGRAFRMWKFRTMVRDADAVFEDWKTSDPLLAKRLMRDWKLDRDPRVTLAGRFLRRSSLDELPQIWNVLRGEMSIVGPRPYLAREQIDPQLAAMIRSVKPGLTGPFQVRGRGSLKPIIRVEIEAEYAATVSLFGDLGYIVRTLKPLFAMDGQ